MTTEYYFLASFLPRLEVGHVPELNFSQFKELMQINLKPQDLEKVEKLLSLIDLENCRALWANEEIDHRGNFTKTELELALLEQLWPNFKPFPQYFSEFLEKYKTNSDRLAHFPLLMSQFLQDSVDSEENESFLKKFFQFERERRLVLVGFRAKLIGRNIDEELQYEDSTDEIVVQLIGQKDSKTFEPPFEYLELRPIFELYANQPLDLHRALYEYQFQKLIEFEDSKHFSMDRILGYLARLLIVEDWLSLDVQEGIGIIDTIERNIQ